MTDAMELKEAVSILDVALSPTDIEKMAVVPSTKLRRY
jgi:hypothetical protein